MTPQLLIFLGLKMAKLNIFVCDLCKQISLISNCKLTLISGRGKDRVTIKAEMCEKCEAGLRNKIDAEVNLEQAHPTPSRSEPLTPVASRRAPPDLSKCQHKNTSFNSPFITCQDCGHQEKI